MRAAGMELERLILREGPDTVAAFIASHLCRRRHHPAPSRIFRPDIGDVLASRVLILRRGRLRLRRTGAWFGKDTVGMRPI